MIVQGWVDWAVRQDGPANKVYSDINHNLGIVCHSMEGWLSGSLAELMKPSRQASWHFSNSLSGVLYQHYPLTASCWASGSWNANISYVAIESEGVAGTPLTQPQVDTALRLFKELGFTERGVNVFEHNEVATKWTPNAGPTACPSGRYDAVFAALGGIDMADPLIDAVVRALTGLPASDPNAAAALEAWNRNGNSLLAGYAIEQKKLADHLANHPSGSGGVFDHTHTPGGVQ